MLQVFSQRKMVPNVLPKSSERRIESVPSVSAVSQPIPSPTVELGLSCDPPLWTAAFLSKLLVLLIFSPDLQNDGDLGSGCLFRLQMKLISL